MAVTPSGIFNVFNEEHPLNADSGIFFNPFPITILLNPEQSWNALSLIPVTLSCIVMDCKFLQPANAYSDMLVALFGILYDTMPLRANPSSLPLIIKQRLSDDANLPVICDKLVQSDNMPFPTSVRLFGKFILFRDTQFSNAKLPNEDRLSEMVIFLKLVQQENALLPIVITLFGIFISVNLEHR